MYYFGGRNYKGKVSNKLFVLQFGSKPLKFRIPKTVGKPPVGRFGHCAHFIKDKNYYLVYGGRNDHIFSNTGISVLEDIQILNLEFMTWCRVKVGITKAGPRYNFSSFYHGKKNFLKEIRFKSKNGYIWWNR